MSESEGNTSAPERMLGKAAACDPGVTRLGILLTVSARRADDRRFVLWFESPSTFVEFLTEAFPSLFCGDDDVSELLENLLPFARVIREEGLSVSVLEELNEYTCQWARVEWLGTFEDLCAADTESTKSIVDWFRADQGGDEGEPITPDEINDFAEFLTALSDT